MCLPLWLHAQEEISKSFSEIHSLEIEGGPLEVSYSGEPGKDDIDLVAYIGEHEEDLVFVTIGHLLKVAYQHRANYQGPRKYLKINGPEKIKLEVRNSPGKVAVNQLHADQTHLSVTSGEISISTIQGDLLLKGSSGNLRVKNIAGSVICSITSGSSIMEDIGGNLDFSSTSGRLNASGIVGRVNAKLTSGAVVLADIGELGKINISSGSVRTTGTGWGKTTQLKGSSGSFSMITPSDLKAFNFDLQASRGSVSVGNSSGGKKLVVQNGDENTVRGNISSGRINITI